MDKVKVIFLDVDGVLNTSRTKRRTKETLYPLVGNRQLKNLRHLVKSTGAKVVLSSDWKYFRDDPEQNSDFLELRAMLKRTGIDFYGFTPDIPSGHRGEEIDLWLQSHPEVSNFVILDDRTDIEPNKDCWVQTFMDTGLNKEKTEKAIRLLNRNL